MFLNLLAVEISTSAAITAGTIVAAFLTGFCKFWFDNRELKTKSKHGEQKQNTYRELLDKKDQLIAELVESIADMGTTHAAKIEELSSVTIEKVEGMGDKNVALLERSITALEDVRDELRELRKDFLSLRKG